MKKSIVWFQSQPLLVFFVLTLLIMFLLGFPLVYFERMGIPDQPLLQLLLLYVGIFVVYGPVLVGMLITRWTLPARSPASAWVRWLSFVVVWLIATVVSALNLRVLSEVYLGWLPLLLISMPIALLPAYVISSAFSRVTSLREYLSTLVRPRGNLIWYLIALLTFPVIHILGFAITQLLTGESRLSDIHMSPGILMATLITFASVFFYSGGINEEGGWRGFAQRRLQAKYSPLVANLLLWGYLVLFHIPNDLVHYQEGNYLLVRLGLYPFITLLFGWVYNRTRGSILAPALFHASMNTMNVLQTTIPGTSAAYVLLVLFALFAVLYDRMWRKLPEESPAVFNAETTIDRERSSRPLDVAMEV